MPSSSPASLARRAVPSAGDFHSRFGVGRRDRIAPVDACGVMLASVHGLVQELQDLDRDLAKLRAELKAEDFAARKQRS